MPVLLSCITALVILATSAAATVPTYTAQFLGSADHIDATSTTPA